MADGARDRICAVVGCALAFVVVTAQAQPLVRVQAGTQIALYGAQSRDGLALHGALLDDVGAPLPDQRLFVELEHDGPRPPQRFELRTASDGTFHASESLPMGRYRLRVRYAGDSHRAGSETERALDLTRADVRLQFIEPKALRIDLDAEPVRVAVRASSARGGSGLACAIEDERGRVLARGTTDADGVFRAALSARALGAPGTGKLIAVSAEDAERSPGRVEIAVLRWRGTRLTLAARDEDGRIAVEGRLSDAGGGLAGKAIGLYERDEHVTTLLTDASGMFRHADLPVRAGPPEGRVLALTARFASDAAGIGDSRSPVVEVALAPAQPPSALWLLAPIAACALALWWLYRGASSRSAGASFAPRTGTGIQLGPGRARGPAEHRAIAGTIRDAASLRPLADVRIALVRDGAQIVLRSDEHGRFESPPLDPGDWGLEISASGYVALNARAAVPHRGEWSDVQVQLQSLRAAALLAYKPAALRMLPSAELWLRWTPRETLANAVKSGRATEAFSRLVARIEQAAYARTPPSENDVADIERTAHEALARFPATPSQPEGSEELRATFPHRR